MTQLSSQIFLDLPPLLFHILQQASSKGWRGLLVGGYTRDLLLTRKPKDIDIELYGVDDDRQLYSFLSQFGEVKTVGKKFGILLVSTPEGNWEFALPRTEKKVGLGHKGFDITTHTTLDFETAFGRRDFTINAMGIDPLTHQLIDPFDGQQDLKNRVLRHVGPAFSEDPLRVLRAAQLGARLGFQVAPETVALCKEMWQRLFELPLSRIRDEWRKLLLDSDRPSIGLRIMAETYALHRFPELAALIGSPQNPQFHPEGDVWTHTLRVVDAMANLRTGDPDRDWILMLAALCHDIGKPATLKRHPGPSGSRLRHLGHDEVGVGIARRFLSRLSDEPKVHEAVLSLVKTHMRPGQLYTADHQHRVSKGAFYRLSEQVFLPNLVLLAYADRADNPESSQWFEEKINALNLSSGTLEPLLQGKDLCDLGIPAGPEIGHWLKCVHQLQLKGTLCTPKDALEWVKKRLPK